MCLYGRLHRWFWGSLDRALHRMIDHYGPHQARWHIACDLHWAVHELAHWTRPRVTLR